MGPERASSHALMNHRGCEGLRYGIVWRVKRGWLGGEVGAEELGLFEDEVSGFFLFVGRIAVLAEDAADHGPELGFDAFFLGLIDGGVLVGHIDEPILRCVVRCEPH